MDFNIQLYVNGEKNSIRLKDAPDDVAKEAIQKFFSVVKPDPQKTAIEVNDEIKRMLSADKQAGKHKK